MNYGRKPPVWQHKALVLGILTTLALGFLAYCIVIPSPIEVDIASATQGSFVQEIQAEAYFRSQDIRVITAFANGDITKAIKVKVGESVQKDQVLGMLYWDRPMMIRAPMDGVISRIFRSDLGPIQRGQALVELMDPTRLEVVAELLTPDAVKVRPGDPVTILGWGDTALIQASVTRVSQAGFVKLSAFGVEEERTEVVVEWQSVPSGMAQRIGSHFHTEVRIQVQRLDNVLKIPVGALLRQGNSWAVFRVIEGRATLTKIGVGPRNNDEAVIETGLQMGDRVLVYPSDAVRDQVRVRPLPGA